jgi:glycosyltransferase involved in cell wall biosynthesis
VVVGGGPQLAELTRRYPSAVFTGPKFGVELAEHYASADVFVFPSLTDTFGNVILEALASGVPVAAYNVMGPKDIVSTGHVGVLGDDLRDAALAALDLDRQRCRAYAEGFSWQACASRFRDIIVEANARPPGPIAISEHIPPVLGYNSAATFEVAHDPPDDSRH